MQSSPTARTSVQIAALLVAFAITAGAASAATTMITHADGTRTQIISNKGLMQIKKFTKDGKLVSKVVDDSYPKQGGHKLAIQKYSKPGDTATTLKGQDR